MGVWITHSASRQGCLHRLLHGLLGVKADDGVGHSRASEQCSECDVVVASEVEKGSCQVGRLRHQAASGRPSERAAWTTLPRTPPHSRASLSLLTMMSAKSRNPRSARRRRTDSAARSSTEGSTTRKSKSLRGPAFPRAWEPKRITLEPGAASDSRLPASSIRASSNMQRRYRLLGTPANAAPEGDNRPCIIKHRM